MATSVNVGDPHHKQKIAYNRDVISKSKRYAEGPWKLKLMLPFGYVLDFRVWCVGGGGFKPNYQYGIEKIEIYIFRLDLRSKYCTWIWKSL